MEWLLYLLSPKHFGTSLLFREMEEYKITGKMKMSVKAICALDVAHMSLYYLEKGLVTDFISRHN